MAKSESAEKSKKSTTKLKKPTARLKAKIVSKRLMRSKMNKSKKTKVFRKKKLTKVILKRRIKREFKNKTKTQRGVVYLGHVPHGFYEEEMRQFFSQFGKVTNINIPRSNRTGKYRGYAFVEFYYPDVAKIVAETMNNYLMFQKVLQAKYIPSKEQKPICFRLRKYKTPLVIRRHKFIRRQNYRVLSDKENNEVVTRLRNNLDKKKQKLKQLGLNYEFLVTNDEPCLIENEGDDASNESSCKRTNDETPSEKVHVSSKSTNKKKKVTTS